MDARLRRVESTVRGLEQSIARIEQRLDALEGAVVAAGARDMPAPAAQSGHAAESAPPALPAPAALPALSRDDLVTTLSFVGRTFVALGGAFLLRALTDAAVVPVPQGIALGLAYALGWLAMSDRAGAANRRTSAAFHGLVATIVAFPLIWESVTRFQLLTPNAAAFTLAFVTALALAVALRQRSQVLAWIAVLAALATSLALVAATGVVLPFTTVTIALGIATLWIGYSADWVLLRWPAALVADLMVLALAERVASGRLGGPARPGHRPPVAAPDRTPRQRRDADARPGPRRERVRSRCRPRRCSRLGSAARCTWRRPPASARTALAAMNLVGGAACYGVAFAFLTRQQGVRRNFYFYTSLGLILVLVSMALLLTGPICGAGVDRAGRADDGAGVADPSRHAHRTRGGVRAGGRERVGTAGGGDRRAGRTRGGPVATDVAGVAGGPDRRRRVLGDSDVARRRHVRRRPPPTAVDHDRAGVVSRRMADRRHRAGAASAAGSRGRRRRHRHGADKRAGRGRARAGLGGTIRAISGVVLAALSGARGGRPEAARRDLPRSRPATLFIALALYGAALIVAPRISRAAGAAAPRPAPA